MAKVLLINGSPNEHGCTYTALHEVEGVLRRHGVETEILWLGRKPVAGCIACNTCARTGHCVFGPETFDDKVNRVLDELDSIDAIVAGSPVYYAAASGQITSFLNRLFYAGGRRMAGKLGTAVVSCRRGGAASAFDQLNKYFTISSMPVVSSQYWNGVHGDRPEEVRADLEGMQTLRLVGDNMAWLLRSMTAAREAGVVPYEREVRVKTNFYKPEAAPNVQGEG